MAKYDDQLARMNYLMEFKNQPKEVRTNIEYHANGADGKVYGILKEGTKYYIKTTESGKENIAESYEYINGFVNRRENEFKSYNDATKHLELKLMSLNEAYGKKSDVSTVDFKRNEKVFANLTEEARKELNRMNQIFENSCKIGKDCQCDPESKGTAKPEQTEKNNDPFNDKVTPDMDFEGSKGTVEGATDNKEVKGVEEDLKSDEKKTENSGSEEDFKDAHDDLNGEGVADKKLTDGKAVVVNINEGTAEPDLSPDDFKSDIEEAVPDFASQVAKHEMAPDFVQKNIEDTANEERPEFDDEEPFATVDSDDVNDDVLVGEAEPKDEEDLNDLLEAFMEAAKEEPLDEEDAITGPDDVLDKEGNSIDGTDNGVDGETSEEWKRIEECEAKEGDEETLKNFQAKGTLPVQTVEKLDESVINSIVESVYNKLVGGAKKETIEEAIDRIVKEEVTKLNVWGKHPKYGKEPMTHPEAKEVLAGTGDRDFNDDSAKGSETYGKKIGDGKPFDEKVVDLLTDQVLAKIKSL